jgi:hypothetical protein
MVLRAYAGPNDLGLDVRTDDIPVFSSHGRVVELDTAGVPDNGITEVGIELSNSA